MTEEGEMEKGNGWRRGRNEGVMEWEDGKGEKG